MLGLVVPLGGACASPGTSPSSGSVPSAGGRVRGPWDHSRFCSVPFDVATVLPPPQRAAVTL